jgi:hypothetical protein
MEGGKAMQVLRSKGLRLLLIIMASIFAFSVTTASAQEKVKVKRKAYGIKVKSEKFKIDDTEGHFLTLSEWKGVTSDGEFTRYATSVGDLIKGNGPFNGYVKYVDRNGNKYFSKYNGMLTTTKSKEGKPIASIKGTYSYIKGTGKFENIQGGGTFKGNFIGKGIYTVDSEGEYVIKK